MTTTQRILEAVRVGGNITALAVAIGVAFYALGLLIFYLPRAWFLPTLILLLFVVASVLAYGVNK